MKKSLLALAACMAAGVAMAADGGTITFKTYLSGSNNMKAVAKDGAFAISSADKYFLTLLDKDLNQVMGTKVGTSVLAPVVASFNAATGFVTAGGDWALKGFDQGKAYDFAVACWLDQAGTGVFSKNATWGASGMYPVMLGGNDLVPPAPAGSFAFGGAQTFVVSPIPEPSVLALGLLGLGAFLIRRRS